MDTFMLNILEICKVILLLVALTSLKWPMKTLIYVSAFQYWSPFLTFPDQMQVNTGCKILIVWGEFASLAFNTSVSTIINHSGVKDNAGLYTYKHCICLYVRLSAQIKKHQSMLILWLTVSLSRINPYTSMLIYRRYLYTDDFSLKSIYI
jgi:hypothetical protein